MDRESEVLVTKTVLEDCLDDSRKETYAYEPLLDEQNEIRLLTLLKGSFQDDVQIELHHVNLHPDVPEDTSSEPAYEALSYTWGDPEDRVDIFVNLARQRLAATRNLAVALRHLRYEGQNRTLWADAACINQQDLIERSRQVLRMPAIFKRARRVVLFTGPETEDSSRALEICEELVAQIQDVSKVPLSSPRLTGIGTMHDTIPRELRSYSDEDQLALEHFLSRDCFTRLWIVPEMRAGYFTGVLMCGRQILPMSTIFEVSLSIFGIYRSKKRPQLSSAIYSRVMAISSALVHAMISLTLFGVINQLKDFECSDPRDRVFAILGCANGQIDEYGIVPDYTKTTEAISQFIAVSCAERTKSLDFFEFCSLPGYDAPSRPSWVPDFSGSNGKFHSLEILKSHLPALFAAEAQYNGANILAVVGVRCAVVQSIKTLSKSKRSYTDDLRTLGDIISKAAIDHPYIGGGNLLEAYCYTLYRGYFEESVVDAPTFWPKFEIIFNLLARFHELDFDSFCGLLSTMDANVDMMLASLKDGTFFVTAEGYVGLTPRDLIIGDEVCFFPGQNVPCCIRKAFENQYRLVGTCYVHGLMDGEAILGSLLPDTSTVLGKGDCDQPTIFFKDANTGCLELKDPRIMKLADPTRAHSWEGYLEEYKRLTSSTSLKERGVPIETFQLI